MFDKRAAVSCKCLILVVELWCCWATHGLPLRASVNPLWLVLSCCHVSWTWSERCVVANILSTVQTENTYTPARLEALFTSSQSSQFVPSKIRGSRFLASDCVVNPSKHFRVEICNVVLLVVRVVPLL